MLKRWQYPWIILALLLFTLAIIGQLSYEVGIVSLYPVLGGIGLLVIAARPKKFGYVMTGLGTVSLAIAVLPADWSPVTRGVLIIVGVGALIGGIRSHKSVKREQ